MSLISLLFTAGILAGLAYWGFGLVASSYFKNKDIDLADRFISTAMLWSLNFSQYDDQGKKLCVYGNAVLAFSVFIWILWVAIR